MWTHSSDVTIPDQSYGGWTALPEAYDPAAVRVPTDRYRQVFTFDQGGTDIVFGANRPVRFLASADSSFFSLSRGSVRLDAPVGAGGSYTVDSARPRVDAALLRSIDPTRQRGRRRGRRGPRGRRAGAGDDHGTDA